MASEIYDMESCVRFWMAGSGWGRCPGRAAVGKVRGQELPSRPTCDGVGTGIREHEPVPVAQLGQQDVLVDAVGAVTGRAPHLRRQAGGFRGRGNNGDFSQKPCKHQKNLIKLKQKIFIIFCTGDNQVFFF